jgi:predicted SpoU family rRNA methylase
MSILKNVLKKEYEQLANAYYKAHREEVQTRMDLDKYCLELSKLVKWSRHGSVVHLNYNQELYEVHKNGKQRNGEQIYTVIKANKVIKETYHNDINHLRLDIVLDRI